jgi:hypothetical protein
MKKTNPADVVSTPNAGTRQQQGEDSANECDSLSQINRFSRQAPGDAKERDVAKLHETKRRQFSKGNTN